MPLVSRIQTHTNSICLVGMCRRLVPQGLALLFFCAVSLHAQMGLLGSSDSTARDSIWRDSASAQAVPDSNTAPKYVKRSYDHRQQVIVGGVVMLCIALTLVGMNNYNPRR